jgi:hypothetical protein
MPKKRKKPYLGLETRRVSSPFSLLFLPPPLLLVLRCSDGRRFVVVVPWYVVAVHTVMVVAVLATTWICVVVRGSHGCDESFSRQPILNLVEF